MQVSFNLRNSEVCLTCWAWVEHTAHVQSQWRGSSFHSVAPRSGLSLPSEHPSPSSFQLPITSKTLVCGIKQKLQHLPIQVMAYVCANRWLRWDKTIHSAWTQASWIGIMSKLKIHWPVLLTALEVKLQIYKVVLLRKAHYSVYVQISGCENIIFFRFILQLHSYNVT